MADAGFDPKRCGRCQKRTVIYFRPADFDGRPTFVCTFCGHQFTNGKTGGRYAVLIHSTPEAPDAR